MLFWDSLDPIPVETIDFQISALSDYLRKTLLEHPGRSLSDLPQDPFPVGLIQMQGQPKALIGIVLKDTLQYVLVRVPQKSRSFGDAINFRLLST